MSKIGLVSDGLVAWACDEPEVSLVDTGAGIVRRASLVAAGEPWGSILAGACDALGTPRPACVGLIPISAASRVLGYARALLVAERHGHARAVEILAKDIKDIESALSNTAAA